MSKWKPIESAPKDGRRILIANARHQYVAVASWNDYCDKDFGDTWCDDEANPVYCEVTHWQDLPLPPND